MIVDFVVWIARLVVTELVKIEISRRLKKWRRNMKN